MATTYDPTSEDPKDTVRLLVSDVGGADGKSFIFQDEEITNRFLLLCESNVRLAAAMALRTLANNEAQVSKRIKFLELSTDGPAVSKALLEAADTFEQEAEDESEVEIAVMSEGSEERTEIPEGTPEGN